MLRRAVAAAINHELIRACRLLWWRAFDAWWQEAERLAIDVEYRLADHLIKRRAGRRFLKTLGYDEP